MLKNKIASLRAQHGLSQQQLADDIEVSRKTISTVETGRFTPSVVIALKIAERFGVSIEDVFELERAE